MPYRTRDGVGSNPTYSAACNSKGCLRICVALCCVVLCCFVFGLSECLSIHVYMYMYIVHVHLECAILTHAVYMYIHVPVSLRG